MMINIQSPGIRTSKKLTKILVSRFSHLERLSRGIMRCDLLLKKDPDPTAPFVVEARLAVPGNDLFSSQRGSSFEAASEKVCAALETQLQRLKSRYQRKTKGTGIDEFLGDDS